MLNDKPVNCLVILLALAALAGAGRASAQPSNPAEYACYPRVTVPATTMLTGYRAQQDIYNQDIAALKSFVPPAGCGALPHGALGVNGVPQNPTVGQYVQQAKFRTARVTLYWDQFDPKGTGAITNASRAAALDSELSTLKALNITPLVVINVTRNPAGLSFANHAYAYAQFAKFMSAAVVRFPSVRYWELWNEMDVGFTDLFGARNHAVSLEQRGRNYAQMLQAVTPAIRQANPNAIIVMGGMASNPSTNGGAFLQGIYDGGGEPFFDIANVHDYGIPLLWQFVSNAVTIRQVMDAHGDAAKPIWVTEFGVSGAATLNAARPKSFESLGDFLDAQQQHQISSAIAANDRYGLYDNAILYDLNYGGPADGLPKSTNSNFALGDNADYGFSLVRSDGVTPRPILTWLMSR